MPSNPPAPEQQLTEGVPSSSTSASSQQVYVPTNTKHTTLASSATATKTACKADVSESPSRSLPWAQQPNSPTAASPPKPSQDIWKLEPVVQSSKAGRLKRKRFSTDLAIIATPVAPKLANPKEPHPNNALLPTDTHATQAAEVVPQLAATDPAKAQALQGDTQAGSKNALPQQSSLMPSGSSEPPDGEPSQPQSQPETAYLTSAAELGQGPSQCSSALVLADQTCCPEEQPQHAQQHRQASLLIERAKALQCQVDQLLAEARQPAPRTVEQLQQEAPHHATQQLTHRSLPQQCCTLAQRAHRHVQVPVRLPEAQSAEVAHRCQGMAVRDCAMPLQKGLVMCAEARPCMAPLKDVQAAAACQQVAADAGTRDLCAACTLSCWVPATCSHANTHPKCSRCCKPTAVPQLHPHS